MRRVVLCVPLKTKRANEVYEALMETINNLRSEGKQIKRFHSDRGREFLQRRFRRRLLDWGVKLTESSGGDPQSNGLAEWGVCWAKSRIRTLLAGSVPTLGKEFWSYAARHLTEVVWEKKILGIEVGKGTSKVPKGVTFGSQVHFTHKETTDVAKLPFQEKAKMGNTWDRRQE